MAGQKNEQALGRISESFTRITCTKLNQPYKNSRFDNVCVNYVSIGTRVPFWKIYVGLFALNNLHLILPDFRWIRWKTGKED